MFFCVLYTKQQDLVRKQSFKLISSDFFFFQQKLRAAMQYLLMLQYNSFGFGITIFNNCLNFPVDLAGHGFTVGFGMSQITPDKYLVIVIIVTDDADIVRHTKLSHHLARYLGSFLDIAGRPGGDILKNDLLGDSSA